MKFSKNDMDMSEGTGVILKELSLAESGKYFLHRNNKRVVVDYNLLDMTGIRESMQI